MPLSHDKKDTGKDIKELEKAGHPHDQSVAIALKETGQSKYNYDEIIKNKDKHKFSEHTLSAIEKILVEKYGPSLKFEKEEEKETTEEFDNLSEEEIQAIGTEIIKDMLEEWRNSDEYKEAEKEEPEEKLKFENDKHNPKDGRFETKNGGTGSAKAKEKTHDKHGLELNDHERKTGYYDQNAHPRRPDGSLRNDDDPIEHEEENKKESPKQEEVKEEVDSTTKKIAKSVAKLPKKAAIGAFKIAGKTVEGMTEVFGKGGTLLVLNAGIAGLGAAAAGFGFAPLAALVGITGITSAIAKSKRNSDIKKEKRKEAESIVADARAIADRIKQNKLDNDRREKVGKAAEEMVARLGDHLYDEKKPKAAFLDTLLGLNIVPKVKELDEKISKDIVERETKKEADKAIAETNRWTLPFKPKEGKYVEKTDSKNNPTDVHELRKGVQKTIAVEKKKAKEKQEAIDVSTAKKKVTDENRVKREAKREKDRIRIRDENRDIRKSDRKEKEKEKEDKKKKSTTDKEKVNDAAKKPPLSINPVTGRKHGTGKVINTPSPEKTRDKPIPQGGTTPENLKGIPGIDSPTSKTVKPKDAPTSKELGDYLKRQQSVKPKPNIYTGQGVKPFNPDDFISSKKEPVSVTTNKAIDDIIGTPSTTRGNTKSAPLGSQLKGLFPATGGEEEYVRGEIPEQGYPGYGAGKPPIKYPPKPGLPLVHGPKKEAPKPKEEPKPSTETPKTEPPKTPYTPNPALEKIRKDMEDKRQKKIDKKKKNFSMESILESMTNVLTKYSCAATMPGGSNTFAPGIKKNKVKFENPEEYETLESVPIFDAHHGEEEGLDIDFNEEMLQKIIDRCNHRIDDTGDHPVIIDGHTEEDENEPKRDVLGFASNFQMGDIGNIKPRKCIYADLHIKKEHVERAKSLPRRSIELWHKDLTADPIVMDRAPIDNIALLGSTRPARDLGLMFQKESVEKISKKISDSDKYFYQYSEDADMDNQMAKELLELVMQLPAMQWAESMAQKQAEDSQKAEAEQMAYDEEHNGEEEAPVEGEENDGAEEVPEKKKDDEAAPGPAKLKMQFEQEKRKNVKLDAEYKALFSKVAELERAERVAQRKSDFMQLEAEGFIFDMADEIETVKDMDVAKFSKHLSNIKKNYKKAPVGFSFVKAVIPGDEVEPQLSPNEVMMKAIKIAEDKYKS